jgi:hypothetical protein
MSLWRMPTWIWRAVATAASALRSLAHHLQLRGALHDAQPPKNIRQETALQLRQADGGQPIAKQRVVRRDRTCVHAELAQCPGDTMDRGRCFLARGLSRGGDPPALDGGHFGFCRRYGPGSRSNGRCIGRRQPFEIRRRRDRDDAFGIIGFLQGQPPELRGRRDQHGAGARIPWQHGCTGQVETHAVQHAQEAAAVVDVDGPERDQRIDAGSKQQLLGARPVRKKTTPREAGLQGIAQRRGGPPGRGPRGRSCASLTRNGRPFIW